MTRIHVARHKAWGGVNWDFLGFFRGTKNRVLLHFYVTVSFVRLDNKKESVLTESSESVDSRLFLGRLEFNSNPSLLDSIEVPFGIQVPRLRVALRTKPTEL